MTRIKILLGIAVILGAAILICLLFAFDPFCEWKLNRAKIKYGIELRPEKTKWTEYRDDEQPDTSWRKYTIKYEDGRYLEYADSYYGSRLKPDNATIHIRYGWAGDSIVCPVEITAIYTLENRLLNFELRDTGFFEKYVHYLDIEHYGTDSMKVHPVALGELINNAEFLEMKSSWEQGEKIWIQPEERHIE